MNGAYEPLKPVVGFVPICLKEVIINEFKNKIDNIQIEDNSEESNKAYQLPF
jgi:hypothetical protein